MILLTPLREVPRVPECCGMPMREAMIPYRDDSKLVYVCARTCGRQVDRRSTKQQTTEEK